jgi:hypothetical protein
MAIGMIVVQGQAGQKVIIPPSQPIKVGHGDTCLSSQLPRRHKSDQVPASQGIKRDPISKVTNTKRVGGMAQVVEHLPVASFLALHSS